MLQFIFSNIILSTNIIKSYYVRALKIMKKVQNIITVYYCVQKREY